MNGTKFDEGSVSRLNRCNRLRWYEGLFFETIDNALTSFVIGVRRWSKVETGRDRRGLGLALSTRTYLSQARHKREAWAPVRDAAETGRGIRYTCSVVCWNPS